MHQQLEKQRILAFLNRPAGQQLFRLRGSYDRYLYMDILPSPGGFIELLIPTNPRVNAKWNLVGRGILPRHFRLVFRFEVASMTQGFIACVFLITKRLGLEMPSELIQFDPNFYQQLPSLTSVNLSNLFPTLNVAARYTFLSIIAFTFHF
ncbi:unnamed protein product [Hymenolepis diminuta]|uniref:Uncharacterized protein n=1 Tax=Hymenolepis diminuta TaxID=6216 RepID=A0A564Z881_HYMDI|nr:unnamed protein product [Hymenolepis diminuta]VUZ55646.1 unnamed protein product [Hymenolepis diminuta]